MRRAVAFAHIAVALRFAFGIEVLEINGARRFPYGLAGLLVEREDVLHVRSVMIIDQQIIPENRRGASTAEMVTIKSRRVQSTLKVLVSMQAVPGEPQET